MADSKFHTWSEADVRKALSIAREQQNPVSEQIRQRIQRHESLASVNYYDTHMGVTNVRLRIN